MRILITLMILAFAIFLICMYSALILASEQDDKEEEYDMEEIKQLNIQPMPDYVAKNDRGKPQLTLVPSQIIYDIARIREYGNRKYPEGGKDNWKTVDPQRYRDAAYRHFLAYIEDPKAVDEESGLPHRWHLECNLAFLAELEEKD